MIAYLIYNILNLAIFGALSLVFEKWWIILFALLFVLLPSHKIKHKRTCDICGKSTESYDTTEEAIKQAEKHGWIHVEENDRDFCPECIKEMRVNCEVDYKRQNQKQ